MKGERAPVGGALGEAHRAVGVASSVPRASGRWAGAGRKSAGCGADVMWPVLWTVVRTYAPYVTFPVAFVVGAVGYHLEWFIRGKDPQPVEEEKSISERREDRKLDELLGKDHTQVAFWALPLSGGSAKAWGHQQRLLDTEWTIVLNWQHPMGWGGERWVLQLVALRERKEKQLTQGHTGGLSRKAVALPNIMK
ncbi:Small Integral Membrane Protein 12 [Manis pentadactyla]|nr:Small Integral Membrane Protein 12 [Manis pentadactyla]